MFKTLSLLLALALILCTNCKIGAVYGGDDDSPLSTATLKCLTSQGIRNFMFQITP
jgi:hypothetical protein